MTAALASGGRHLFGWGVDRFMTADIFDALNVNTRATGNWAKGKIPTFPQWPRPGDELKTQAKPKVTVADLYSKLTRR